jgi:phosphatidylglycerol---prolipoprotein diacylglyceryl transferase
MPALAIAYPVFDPVAIALGPIVIRWYALAYIGGIVLGWIYARALIKSTTLWGGPAPITLLDMDDYILWVTIGIILGGRTGYVLFYNFDFFIKHPAEILELWKGGMSFHGGFMGCVAAVMLFCWKRNLPILSLGDITTAVGPIGLFLGRCANFINGELWGREAPAWWPGALIYPQAGPPYVPRFPSELYEAFLEGVVLLTVLLLMARSERVRAHFGMLTGVFLAGYAVARIVSECFRQPDAFLGYIAGVLTMGQILSIPMLLIGLGLIAWSLRADRRSWPAPG